MSEPLDFSSVGAKAPAPPPKVPRRGPKAPRSEQKASKAPPKRIGWSSRARMGGVLAGVVVVVAAGVLVFGRGGTKPAVDMGQVAAGARYCEVANDFDRVVRNAAQGADLVGVPGPVIQDVLAQMGVSMAEMTTTAPAEIRSDVAATVKALRDAASGNPAGIHAAAFLEQRQRIDGYRQTNCSSGSGSGEQ